MNPFTSILQLFKPKSSESSESHKRWLEGLNAYQKAETLLRKGQTQDALGCLDSTLNCGYDAHGLAYSARGLCLQAIGFDLDAIDDFSRAIASDPKDSNLYLVRSISKGATGDFRGSVADLEEAIRVAPPAAIPQQKRPKFQITRSVVAQTVAPPRAMWVCVKLASAGKPFSPRASFRRP